MGFKEIKKRTIDCIKNGCYEHEKKEYEKNLFADGQMSADELIKIISYCNGDCLEIGRHHNYDVELYIMKPIGKYDGYYIKYYFVEPNTVFISVHT